jgi:hypothetical protein
MAMFCSKCQSSYQQRLKCPQCGGRLDYQPAGRSSAGNDPGDRSGRWQETPWGRIAVGLLLAQGLYYGLWHLGNAGMLAVDSQLAASFWSSMPGLIVVQALQAVGLLLGGSLAGAGRQRGIMFGALVGVWNGLLFLIMQSGQKHLLTPVALYGQPLLQTAFGALGGAIGRFIWKPPSDPVVPALAAAGGKATPAGKSWLARRFAGPIAWGRVLVGTAVAIAGSLSAGLILDFVLEAGHGKLAVETHLQAHLITWEITALAVVVGSALAGATTRNGLKQGLCVGILTSVVLGGAALSQARFDIFVLVLTVATAMTMALAGGWFGGNLFPPLIPASKRRERVSVMA